MDGCISQRTCLVLMLLTLAVAATRSDAAYSADGAAGPAQPAPSLAITGDVALVSDYRFRGVSVSGKDPALQGSLGVAGALGHLAVWGSSIESFNGAELELDATVGREFAIAGVDLDAGLIGYVFPGGDDTDYVEVYANAGGAIGPLSWSAGVNYAPDQKNIGGRDSIYVFSGLAFSLPAAPLALEAGAGFEDGAFGADKWDWHVGLRYTIAGINLGLAYVDARDDRRAIPGTAVFSISRGF